MSEVERREPLGGLFTQTLLYGATRLATLAVPVFLAPILTHYLAPADYGTVALFQILFLTLGPLVGLGVQTAVRRRYFDLDAQALSQYVTSALGAPAASLATLTAVMAIGCLWFPEVQGIPSTWMFVLVPWTAGAALIALAASFYQLEQRAIAHGVLTGGLSVVNVALSLLLVIEFDLDWRGRVLGQVIATLLFAAASVVLLGRRLERPLRFSRADTRHAVVYGAPTVPYTVLERVIGLTDRAVVLAHLGLAAAGIYTLATQLGGLLLLLTNSFSLAWQPWLFSRLKRNRLEDRTRILAALGVAGFGVVVGSLVLAGFGPTVFRWVIDERFDGAYPLLPLLVTAFAFRGLSAILSSIVLFEGTTGSLSRVTVIGATVNLVGNLLLVPRYGLPGAAAATCIAFGTTFAVMSSTVYRSWARLRDSGAHPPSD